MSSGPFRIDSHHHLWDPARGDYSWMEAGSPLDRPFGVADHSPLNEAAGIGATVVVQAAPTVAETAWLLERSRDPGSRVVAVVGWIDLTAADPRRQLASIEDPLLVGIRPMIQDLEPDWIEGVERSLHAVAAAGLAFDLLARPRHLPAAVRVLARVPDLRVVVDHLAKPSYRDWDEGWAENIRTLARRDNTWMKVSGLATEVEPPWDAGTFGRHVEFVLDQFGAERVMLGTDWPVSTLAADHATTVALLDSLVVGCSRSEGEWLWHRSCAAAYGLDLANA
jgi:L-fuconolactonase